jgi:hypothetical protein
MPGTEEAPAALNDPQRARWSGHPVDSDALLLARQHHEELLLEEELLEDQLRRLGVALD